MFLSDFAAYEGDADVVGVVCMARDAKDGRVEG